MSDFANLANGEGLPKPTEKILAMKAIVLLDFDDFMAAVVGAHGILAELEKLAPADFNSFEKRRWLTRHPISQLLVHRLRNIVIQNPEDTFVRARNVVLALAKDDNGASQINSESVRPASGTFVSGTGREPVERDPQRDRVANARKRLRS